MKPVSLRELETTIWKNLFLVARCKLDAETMVDHVLDSIITPSVLNTFQGITSRLHQHFVTAFDPIRDHISFFLPGTSLYLLFFWGRSLIRLCRI